MKKSLFLVIAFLSISMGIKAQGVEQLIGNWEFADIPDSENLDEKKLDMLIEMYQDIAMSFYDDGTYMLSLGGKDEEGTYTYDSKALNLKDEKGKVTKTTVKFLPENQILFTKGDMSVILYKVELDEELDEDSE